jgi:hypothetical protein
LWEPRDDAYVRWNELCEEGNINVGTGNGKEMKDEDRKEINFSEKLELRMR